MKNTGAVEKLVNDGDLFCSWVSWAIAVNALETLEYQHIFWLVVQ